MSSRVVVAFVVALGLGCGAPSLPIRASTDDHIPRAEATVDVPASQDDVSAALARLFGRRGYERNYNAEGPGGSRIVAFSGPRQTVTSVVATESMMSSSTLAIGSMFAAILRPIEGGGTRLFLLGKPTLNGVHMCSDADSLMDEFEYFCTDTTIAASWNGRAFMTGREEVDTVRSVLLDLQDLIRASARPPPSPPPPPTPEA